MVEPREIRKGDMVRVIGIPQGLHDSARIGTPDVFASAVGHTFHVQEISERGLLELHLRAGGTEAKRLGAGVDVIWIEPELVQKVS